MIVMDRDKHLQMTDDIVQAAEQLDELNEIDYIELPVLWEILQKYIQPSHSSGKVYVDRAKRMIQQEYPVCKCKTQIEADNCSIECDHTFGTKLEQNKTMVTVSDSANKIQIGEVATVTMTDDCPPYVKSAIGKMLELLAESERKIEAATKVAEGAIVKPWKPQ